MVLEYFKNLALRIEGLILEPVSELRSVNSGYYTNYLSYVKSYFLLLIFTNPSFTLLAKVLYSSSYKMRSDFLFPLGINIVIILFIPIIGIGGSALSEYFNSNISSGEYSNLLLSAFIPFMVSGVFKLIPAYGNYFVVLALLYSFFLIHLIWREVFLLSFLEELSFFLLQSLFLLILGILATSSLYLYRMFAL